MKTKSKTQAILEALLNGEKLTTKTCMQKCGTYKLSNRIGELERKYNFFATRKWVKSKSRYGGTDEYMQYSIDNQQIKILKKLLKNFQDK
jgi:hypothetical protein